MLIDPCEILIIFLIPSLGFSSAPRQILVNRFVSPRSVDIQDIFEQQIYISALYRYPFTVGNRLIYILSIGIPILLISFAVRSLVIPSVISAKKSVANVGSISHMMLLF